MVNEEIDGEQDYNTQDPYENMLNPQSQDAASLLAQINPADIVVNLRHALRGEAWDATKGIKGRWVKSKQGRLLNEQGIGEIIMFISGIVNTNCILSNLTEKEVERIILTLGYNITDLLAQKWEKFDIVKSNLTPVTFLCLNMSYFALKRSFDEGERNFLKKSISSHEYIQFKPQSVQQKSGMNSMFNPFSKG